MIRPQQEPRKTKTRRKRNGRDRQRPQTRPGKEDFQAVFAFPVLGAKEGGPTQTRGTEKWIFVEWSPELKEFEEKVGE